MSEKSKRRDPNFRATSAAGVVTRMVLRDFYEMINMLFHVHGNEDKTKSFSFFRVYMTPSNKTEGIR